MPFRCGGLGYHARQQGGGGGQAAAAPPSPPPPAALAPATRMPVPVPSFAQAAGARYAASRQRQATADRHGAGSRCGRGHRRMQAQCRSTCKRVSAGPGSFVQRSAERCSHARAANVVVQEEQQQRGGVWAHAATPEMRGVWSQRPRHSYGWWAGGRILIARSAARRPEFVDQRPAGRAADSPCLRRVRTPSQQPGHMQRRVACASPTASATGGVRECGVCRRSVAQPGGRGAGSSQLPPRIMAAPPPPANGRGRVREQCRRARRV